MSLAGLVVTAVKVQGRPKAAVARDYRVSRRWVTEDGELLRQLTLDPTRDYQPHGQR